MNVQIKKGVKLLMSKDKMPQRNTAKDYFMIVLGSLIVAVAYVYFFTPHKIVPGGVYGISIMLHHLSQELVSMPSWRARMTCCSRAYSARRCSDSVSPWC